MPTAPQLMYSSAVGMESIQPFVAQQLQKPQAHIGSRGETKLKINVEYVNALLFQTGL
jgi:hypothetical protein